MKKGKDEKGNYVEIKINPRTLKEVQNLSFTVADAVILMNCYGRTMSVAELQESVGIAYKNLYTHLKKLERFRFIIIKDNGKGKKKEVSVNQEFDRIKPFVTAISLFFGLYDEILKEKKK